jgi:hypothetical protein
VSIGCMCILSGVREGARVIRGASKTNIFLTLNGVSYCSVFIFSPFNLCFIESVR